MQDVGTLLQKFSANRQLARRFSKEEFNKGVVIGVLRQLRLLNKLFLWDSERYSHNEWVVFGTTDSRGIQKRQYLMEDSTASGPDNKLRL